MAQSSGSDSGYVSGRWLRVVNAPTDSPALLLQYRLSTQRDRSRPPDDCHTVAARFVAIGSDDRWCGLSGFQKNDVYDLTATKAASWHGRRQGCNCDSLHNPLGSIYEKHLQPAGFSQEESPSQYVLRLRGPGISERRTAPLFEALSGRAARQR